jgi:hypothetical protein
MSILLVHDLAGAGPFRLAALIILTTNAAVAVVVVVVVVVVAKPLNFFQCAIACATPDPVHSC